MVKACSSDGSHSLWTLDLSPRHLPWVKGDLDEPTGTVSVPVVECNTGVLGKSLKAQLAFGHLWTCHPTPHGVEC